MPDRQPQTQREAGPRPDPKAEPHHIADAPVTEAEAPDATVQSPVTETGLPVEQQIRKEWDPKKDGGLPTSLRRGTV